MSDERSYFTVGGTERDSRVDTGGEGGDTVFEEMSNNLHDCRFMLDDGDVGRVGKFTECQLRSSRSQR